VDTKFWGWVFFSFNGRITRMYYWITALVLFIIQMIFFGVFFGANMNALASGDVGAMSPLAALCALPLSLLAIWVGLAVSVKRWHDRAKSGWWVLIGLIPLVGPIWVLVECGFLPGTDGVNQYGIANVPPSDPLRASGSSANPTESREDNPYAP
jgi:uncharacterized membrane protein YhaH (DUF805 family)